MNDFKTYQNISAVNWSTLKHMAKSPLAYKYALDNGSEDSTGRLKGRGTHTLVLEPKRFPIEYAVFPGKTRRGKEWEAFKELHADKKDILKIEEHEHCLRVAEAVYAHPVAAAILARAQREVTIEWVDEETGIRCKARLDLLDDGNVAVVDLKGVRSVYPAALPAEVARGMYHCQLAFYRRAARSRAGKMYRGLLICAEHKAPHDVVVRDVDEDALYAGDMIVRDLLKRVAECQKADRWPGCSDKIESLSLPTWVWKDDDNLDDVGFEIKEAGG